MVALNSALLLAGLSFLPYAGIAEASYVPTYQLQDYNPFDDGKEVAKESKDPSQMTFKERLAQQQAEEKAKMSVRKSDFKVTDNAYIPAGLKFNVELTQAVSSKGFKKGSLIKVRVCDNIILNDVVVVEKGSAGTAYIYEARKAGGMGRKGKLQIAGNEVRTVNGVPVPLRGGLSGKGKTDGGAGVVFAAVSIVGGLFMKGSNITYPEGTMFEVEVREDVDLGCKKTELAEAMNPNKPHGVSIRMQ